MTFVYDLDDSAKHMTSHTICDRWAVAIPGGCSPKFVKVDLEPVVDALVDGMVPVTDLLARGPLL